MISDKGCSDGKGSVGTELKSRETDRPLGRQHASSERPAVKIIGL